MCALFNKSDEDDADDVPPAEDASEAAGSPEPTGNDPDAAGDGVPEHEIDVESTLKELAARMSTLSSNIEGMQDDRSQLEEKLGEVEDRMSRLGNLAEAVSSEYNPFIQEASPDDPRWDGEPEAGLDPAPAAGAAVPGDASEPEAVAEGDPALPEDEPPRASPGSPGADSPGGAVDEEALPDLEALWSRRGNGGGGEPDEARTGARDDGPRDLGDAWAALEGDDGDLRQRVLLIEWVGFMLRRVGRHGLVDLLEYYQSLGWTDAATKNLALRVATGLRNAPRGSDEPRDVRGDLDLHEISLLALERLRGRELPAARLEEIQLDVQRLFDR